MNVNLLQQLEASVRIHGDKPSLLFKQSGAYETTTYSELWHKIQSFAAGLRQLGVGPGDKVGLLSTNRPEWPITDYAAMYLQAVVVPIYPTLPPTQVRYILQNADVTCLIVENAEQLAKIVSPWPDGLSSVVCMDTDASVETENVLRFEDVLINTDAEPGLVDIDEISDEVLTTIVHTSGTSGQPKGVMLTHRNIVSNVEGSLALLPVDSADITLSYLPLSHIFERTVGQYAILARGAAIAYAESIETIQQNLAEVRPTVLVTVPRLLEKVYTGLEARLQHLPKPLVSLYKKTIQRQRTTGLAYQLFNLLVFRKLRKGLGGRIRAIVSGGAGLAEKIGRFYTLAGLPVYEGYGMTESAPVIAANPLGKARPGTVGQPIPGVRVRLDEDGELLVRGPNVMVGYYHQPDETAAVLSDDGWLRTGDIAEMDEGYIRIVERKKNILVLTTGKNVAPWPIESAIMLQPLIASAVLIGDGRKYVTALIVPDFTAMTPLLQSHQIEGEPETLINQDVVRNAIRTAVQDATESFASFERPKRAVLLPTDFTIESGDLTPSLKVRNRVILQKYSAAIDAMYEGENYLAIFDDPTASSGFAAGNVTVLAAVSEDESPKKTEAQSNAKPPLTQSAAKRISKTTLLVAALAAICIAAFELHPPGKFDLVGTIHHIGGNTKRINQVNGNIVGTMKSVNQKAGKTSSINDSLSTLDAGVVADKEALSNLNQLSVDENSLSKQFLSVATGLNDSLSHIGSASQTQNDTLTRMITEANQIDRQMQQLADVNSQIGSKLATAKSKTDTLANEMP